MTSDVTGRHGCPLTSVIQGSSVSSGPGHSLDPKFAKEHTTSKVVFMRVLTFPLQHPTDPSNRANPADQKARAGLGRSGLGNIAQVKTLGAGGSKFSKDRNKHASDKPQSLG